MLLCALPPSKAAKKKAILTYRFGIYEHMQPALHLMAPDTMYGPMAVVPGLYRLRGCVAHHPV